MASQHVFVVGCSRSGTSLIQKKVAERFGLWTIPETEFFLEDLDRMRGRLHALIGVHRALTDHQIRYRDYAKLLALLHFSRVIGVRRVWAAVRGREGAEQAFKAYFSQQAQAHLGRDAWLEKSPRHFLKFAQIRRAIPSAKFIFVIRRGEDVVASILDRHRKWPQLFPQQGDYRYGASLWNQALRVALERVDDPQVLIVDYADFVQAHASCLQGIGRFLGQSDAAQVDDPRSISVARQVEGWKATLDDEMRVRSTPLSRFLGPSDVAAVSEMLESDRYQRLVAASHARMTQLALTPAAATARNGSPGGLGPGR